MKTLIILPYSFYSSSGSSLSSYYRIKALTELGVYVDIVTYPHGENISDSRIKTYRCLPFRLFKLYNPGEIRKKIPYDIFCFFLALYKIMTKKYDFVSMSSSAIYFIILYRIFFPKKKFIATMHGNLEIEIVKWKISRKRWGINLASKLDKVSIDLFDLVICEHKSVKKFLINKGVNKRKLKMIPLAAKNILIDTDFTRYNKNFKVLYTGTFVKLQNLILLFKTAQLLKEHNISFILIGANKKEYEEYSEIRRHHDLNDNFIIELKKNYDDLYLDYKRSDIVVSPRVYGYDTPMKIIEYLNYGKCILATDSPIHREVLNNDIAYLSGASPEEFANSIIYLKENPRLVREYEIKAKEFFKEKFDFNIMKSNYQILLHEEMPNMG